MRGFCYLHLHCTRLLIGFFSDQVEGKHEEDYWEEKTSVVIDNIWLYSFTAARITRKASPANNLGEKWLPQRHEKGKYDLLLN